MICVAGSKQVTTCDQDSSVNGSNAGRMYVILPLQIRDCVRRKQLQLPHTEELCSLEGCVTRILLSVLLLIPVGNGSFCISPMGRWFVVDWSRTSQSGLFVYLSQKIHPCGCQFKDCGKLTVVCPHWGNTGRAAGKASKTPKCQVLIQLVGSWHAGPFLDSNFFLALKYNAMIIQQIQ